MCPVFISAMHCTADLISDFVMNYIAYQGVGRSSSHRILSGDQNIGYSGFSNGQLSLTGVDIDMDTVKNVKFPEQQCTAQWI